MTTADVLALVPEPEPEAALETARAEDRERVGTARADSRSAATRRAYRAQWKTFLDWCAVRQVNALPADAGDVAAFLADRAREKRAATVAQGAAAIRAAHHAADLPDPTATPVVRETLQGIRHQHARLPELAPRQAKPLDYDGAVKLLALSDRPQPSGRNGLERPERAASRGSLDRCIVALLFCAGMRRSEVAALRWADVEETARPGQLRVRVRTSKANQDGARADWRLLVSGFAAALRDRRERVRPADGDRVVPLSPAQVARRLAALGRVAGIEGLSGHSGRVGMAADLIRRGASTTSVQDAGGWRDPGMVARYAASVDVEDGAIARYFGNGA